MQLIEQLEELLLCLQPQQKQLPNWETEASFQNTTRHEKNREKPERTASNYSSEVCSPGEKAAGIICIQLKQPL